MRILLDMHPRYLVSCPLIGLQRAAQLSDDEDDDSPADEPPVPLASRVNGTAPAAHDTADEMKCA
jgi:hypothetical protein